jgi:hypothetical protein
VEERDGLIWVWPGSKDEADPNEISRVLPVEEGNWVPPFMMATDLDIDHSLMVENLLDPAHIPFTHEGTLGKRSGAKPLQMADIAEVEISKWFNSAANTSPTYALRGTVDGNGTAITHFHFIPPCFVILHNQFDSGKRFRQTMLCVPRKPGHMRLIYMQSRDFLPWLDRLPGMEWLMQLMSAKIQFQDYELLHGQQARLQQGSKAWHAPIQVDGLPRRYREWLRSAHKLDYGGPVKQDDYWCQRSGASNGPYFSGWNRHCEKSAADSAGDIEDIPMHPCHQDCSVPPTFTAADQLDDEWSIPRQRGVDNSAYTWRRDRQMGRNGNGNRWLWWGFTTGSVAIAVAMLLAAQLRQ